MIQIVEELSEEFTELQKNNDIYLSPTIIELAGRRSLQIQVCDGGVTYSDFDGGVRREHFEVLVGILKVWKVDTSGEYWKFLTNLQESMFTVKERIIDVLEGTYLEFEGANLLTRPLRIHQESRVKKGREKGLLIKELSFVGGLNVLR